jgi:hypothetical protein
MLWRKAIPAKKRIKEIEEVVKRELIGLHYRVFVPQ